MPAPCRPPVDPVATQPVMRAGDLYTNAEVKALYSEHIQKAIRFIGDNYMNPSLSLLDVAEHAGLSQSYLGQLFKDETGLTINTMITQMRLANAMAYLAKSEWKIHTIASMVGYRSGQYFSHVFSKCVGLEPRQYRRLAADFPMTAIGSSFATTSL